MADQKTISLEELAKHNNAESCWLAIDGKVYDVTDYDHPGGKEMLMRGCGRDCSEIFKQKREQGIFTKEAEEDIQKYLVGILDK